LVPPGIIEATLGVRIRLVRQEVAMAAHTAPILLEQLEIIEGTPGVPTRLVQLEAAMGHHVVRTRSALLVATNG